MIRLSATILRNWLRTWANDFAKDAAQEAVGKKGTSSRRSSTKITSTSVEKHARITATGPFAVTRAFDYEVRVPVGGFRPKTKRVGRKGGVFVLFKPEGIRFRTRTYTRFSGQTLKRKGFFSSAIGDNFAGPEGKLNLMKLGKLLIRPLAVEIARHIVMKINTGGLGSGVRAYLGRRSLPGA